MNKVIKLADAVDDVRFDDVDETLRWVREQLAEGGVYAEQGYRPTKCIVLMVDEHANGYHVKLRPSAMKCSEELALLEVAKATVVRQMLED